MRLFEKDVHKNWDLKFWAILGADKIFQCLKTWSQQIQFFNNKTFFGRIKSWNLDNLIRTLESKFFVVTIFLTIFTVNSTHIGEHGRSVSTQWRKDTCQPKHVPQSHQMSKCKKKGKRERQTHTQDAQWKGKWMCFTVTIVTFFWKRKKDHNCNWDYLNRHPQELRFQMSDMLGACQIFKCLTPFSMTLRF